MTATLDDDVAALQRTNTELRQRLDDALARETAATDILRVINSSGDLAPVFEAMLDKAARLCRADFASFFTYDGEQLRPLAVRGATAAGAEFLNNNPLRPTSDNMHGRMISGEPFVQILDTAKAAHYFAGDPATRAFVELGGGRTALAVALRKGQRFLGEIMVCRRESRGFSDKDVALLQNFAAQAVLAMENARLITETRVALEQQTATAEVLRVISGSTTDIQPVFEAITARAAKLCEAEFSAVARFDDGLLRLVAVNNMLPQEAAAFHSLFPRAPTRGFVMGRAFVEGRMVHLDDVLADPDYDPRTREVLQSLTGYRTFLGVPVLRDGKPVGVIGCARRAVRPFTPAQIELVSTFADQAVIAIENCRLFNDLRQSTDELAQRQAELRVTFDSMADGVVMFDEALRLAAWNRNFEELLDLPAAFLAARPSYADYLRVLAERGEFGTDDSEAELSRRLNLTDRDLRLERTRPDGQIIEVRRNAVPDGGFVLIYSDVTERKRSEAEIRAARDVAEAAYHDLQAAQANLVQAEKMASLGQLTAGIAHEIKNPLNFVNNFATLSVELLDELKETAAPALATLGDESRREIDETIELLTGNLDKIAEHGRRADGIVRSMLEHSRGGSGELRGVDINALVEEALNLAYHGARARDQNFNITLERDFAAGIGPIELVPQDITRVCLNLFGNGFYATAKRREEAGELDFKPVLKVSTRDLGDAVEISVRDNGIGMPAEITDKLFQPFFTTKPTGEGTGLGLSISYDIVTQQHGGTIEVASRVGEFTEFTVRLPRDRPALNRGAAN
jgi:signal transduction histidine kinase